MIDRQGYRANVGIIICNQSGQLLWAKRRGQAAWQFPQGGINQGESIEEALYRELFEEVGLKMEDVRTLSKTRCWIHYKLPKHLIRRNTNPICIGQKQRWFLLLLQNDDSKINIQGTGRPEFDDWRWVSYWYPVRQAIAFKRHVYQRVMCEFVPSMITNNLFLSEELLQDATIMLTMKEAYGDC